MQTINLAGREVGARRPCFIIAEAGVNHNGDLSLAKRLVEIAADAGADAVKFQTFKADKVVSVTAPKAPYQVAATGNAESQLEMIRKLELPFEAFAQLNAYCSERGILFLSTPFDTASADYLEGLGMAAFKVPSGEVTNTPFLEYLARKRRPLILSTGMSTMAEVKDAVCCIRQAGDPPLALLHCVSQYPAAPETANLRAMRTLAAEFSVPVGYSDHTLGNEVPLAAVALGACIIEKHFTLDRALPGPDHQASADPAQLRLLVEGVRKVEACLGHGRKEPAPGEVETANVARRSLVAATDIASGRILTADMIAVMRPGTGMPPAMLSQLVGRRLHKPMRSGELFSLDSVE